MGNINILISDRTYEPWIHYNVKWLSGERVDIYTTPIPPEKQAELEGKDFLDYSDSVLGRHINFTGDTETWWKETIYIGGKDIVCLVNMEVDEPRCRVNFLYEDIAVQITLPKSDFENGFLNKLSFK